MSKPSKPLEEMYCKYTDVTFEEHSKMMKYLLSFENPIYVEVGVYFGGHFKKVLEDLKSEVVSLAIGIDLFEDIAYEIDDKNIQSHQIFRGDQNGIGAHAGVNVAHVEKLQQILLDQGYKNFSLYKGCSDQTIRQLSFMPNMFFIDGNHTYKQVSLDVEAAYTKSNKGTVIVLHNSSFDKDLDYFGGGPYKLSEEMRNDDRFEFLDRIERSTFFYVN